MSEEKKVPKKTKPAPPPHYHGGYYGGGYHYPRHPYYYRRPPLYNRWSLNSEGMLLPSDQTDMMWKAANHLPPAYHYLVQTGLERGTFDVNYGQPYDPEEHEGGEDFAEGTAQYWMVGRYNMTPFKGHPKPYGSFTSPLLNPDKGMPPALRRLRQLRREEEGGGIGVPATPSLGLM